MATESEILAAAKRLQQGDVVAFPTETVYGLGAHALDAIAVAKIFELKERPRFDPLIVHIADASQLSDLVTDIPVLARDLIEAFWPGPLSLVLSKRPHVPDIVTAGLPSVAIRCPENPVAQRLIRAADLPVAAPSANRFGMVSPTTAEHVKEQFAGQIPFILDDGPSRIGVESTVISFTDSDDGRPKLLRPGGVTLEQVESITGPLEINMHEDAKPTSPGQLSRHYSPRTPLVLADSMDDSLRDTSLTDKRVGVLCFSTLPTTDRYEVAEVLSKQGDFREAATHLFAAMRRLDALDLDLIIAESVPEIELGRAIMDRLRRAATP